MTRLLSDDRGWGDKVKIVLMNPAVLQSDGKPWGDEYFGEALEKALITKGCTVRQQYWPDWTMESEDDVVLVLRGKRQWKPPEDRFSILWILSHPGQVEVDEVDAFNLVITASELHCEMLRSMTDTPIRVARQCTDHRLFRAANRTIKEEARDREGVVYVARSRGVRRDMAQWIDESGLSVRVFGNGWERFGLEHLVERVHIPNRELPEVYQNARMVLNDHWLDMRGFGYINNRVLDCLACGTPVVTDEFPELSNVFGNALIYANDAVELANAVEIPRNAYHDVLARCRDRWKEIGWTFSFEYRAGEILEWIRHPPAPGKRSTAHVARNWPQWTNQIVKNCVYHEDQRAAYLERKLQKVEKTLGKDPGYTKKLEKELHGIRGSLSWKLTRPVRVVGRSIRNIKKWPGVPGAARWRIRPTAFMVRKCIDYIRVGPVPENKRVDSNAGQVVKELEQLAATPLPREDQRGSHRAQVRMLIRKVEQFPRTSTSETDRAIAIAKGWVHLKQWDDALAWLESVTLETTDEGRLGDLILGRSICYAQLGKVEEAREERARLKTSGQWHDTSAGTVAPPRSFARIRLEHVDQRIREQRCFEVADEIWHSITAHERAETGSLVREFVAHRGGTEEVADAYIKVLNSLQNRPSEPPITDPARGPKLVPVFVGGFGWSGSGAVFDFLADHPSTALPLGRAELDILEGKHGLGDMSKRASEKSDMSAEIRCLTLGPLLGLAHTKMEHPETRWKRSVAAQFFHDPKRMMDFANAVCRFHENAVALGIGNRADAWSSIITALIQDILAVGADGRPVCILNNVVHAKNFDLLSILPNSIGIAVLRDARDCFAFRDIEKPSNKSAAVVQKELNSRFTKYKKALKGRNLGDRVMEVRFEEFVVNDAVREAVDKFCNLESGMRSRSDSDRFHPERSQNNIGAYRHQINARMEKKIRRNAPSEMIYLEEYSGIKSLNRGKDA